MKKELDESQIRKKIDKELKVFIPKIPKIKCDICGKYENKRSNNHRFCSKCIEERKRLRQKGYFNQKHLKKMYEGGNKNLCIYSCLNCNKKGYGYIIKKRRFCKNKCQYEWASKYQKPHNKQNIKIKCKTCKSIFVTNKSSIRLGRKFCSRFCYETDHKINWTFPHKGKKIEEWMFNGDQLKLSSYRKKLSERMIKYFKEHPEIMEARKGKTFLELYGEEVAKKMKKTLSYHAKKQWDERREYLLQTKGRFKKNSVPWNKGKKLSEKQKIKIKRTKELNFLKGVGLNV